MTDETRDTQARILDAAEKAFADHGLAGARVNAIAAEAGVNKAMLYYYFESKDGLYEAVLERVLSKFLEVVHERLGTIDEDNVGAFLAGYRGVLRAHPHFVRLMVREVADGGERVVPLLLPKIPSAMTVAVGGLTQAQAEGRLNPNIHPMVAMPVMVAPFILFALANPMFARVTGIPAEMMTPLFDQTAEQVLLHGLLRHDTPEEP